MNKGLKISKISILSIMLIMNIISFNFLPKYMFINYTLAGQPNYSINKIVALLICPLLIILMYILENSKIPKKGSDSAIFSAYIVTFLINLFLLIANFWLSLYQ